LNYTVKLVERISTELKHKLYGYAVNEVFSSGKNEFYLNFVKGENEFGIKLLWASRKCFVFFLEEKFDKPIPYRNEFIQLDDAKILSIRSHRNNRSLQIELENDLIIVIKFYNGLSNVLLFKDSTLVDHFRKSIENDAQLLLKDFDQNENFQSQENELEKADDLFQAFQLYNRRTLSKLAFDEMKANLLHQNQSELKRLKQLVSKSTIALKQISEAVPFDEIGNILMANLDKIKPKESQIELFDFYRDKNILIKLKNELNAAQNAEYYYKKSKNQHAEIEQLNERIKKADIRIEQLQKDHQLIEQAESQKELKIFYMLKPESKTIKSELFKEFECDGFKILVGKNAANNDLLTMKYSHKNDLWLHAKGVSGSHVVVKHISGKPFPKKVIDHAASIAAYYSKSKGSAFVPVVFVERKYVRKPKGAQPGAVIVEKEEIVLVKPNISLFIF